MKDKLFSYNYQSTVVHKLSGLSKLICFLLLTFAVMFSFDPRVILFVLGFSTVIFKVSRIKYKQIKLMVIYVSIFIVINAIITFIFSPEEAVSIYGTRHVLFHIVGPYIVTSEQLLYQGTKLLKYASLIPLGMIFLLTTNPSELAAALNSVGVHYKAAYAFSLTMRYFPDIQREYRNISLSQQARGLEISKKAKFFQRIKNSLLIIIPLVFSTLDRIETISNTMDLRGFGKYKNRTWYSKGKLNYYDIISILMCILIFSGTILVSVFVNKSRFYNPFL